MFSEVQLVMECLKMCPRTGRKRILKRAEVSGLLTVVLSDDVAMSNNAPDWVRCGPSFIAIQWQCSV
jgi:hypothetical protein